VTSEYSTQRWGSRWCIGCWDDEPSVSVWRPGFERYIVQSNCSGCVCDIL